MTSTSTETIRISSDATSPAVAAIERVHAAIERASESRARPAATPIGQFAREATAAATVAETTLDDEMRGPAFDRKMCAIDNAAISPATDANDLRIKAALLVRVLLDITPLPTLDTEHALALRLAAGLLADATTLAAGDPPPA